MLRRLRTWLRESQKWSRDHRDAWAGVTDPDSGGLSPFQRGTEVRVRDALQRRGLALVDRRVVPTHGDADNYVTAKVPELQAEIWMYRDQTDVASPHGELRLEEWDTRTPEEHYARVIQFLESLPLTGGAF